VMLTIDKPRKVKHSKLHWQRFIALQFECSVAIFLLRLSKQMLWRTLPFHVLAVLPEDRGCACGSSVLNGLL
jgi:hypothetical protein